MYQLLTGHNTRRLVATRGGRASGRISGGASQGRPALPAAGPSPCPAASRALTPTEKMALRALALRQTELADGQGWIVEGERSHRVTVNGDCDCLAYSMAPTDTPAPLKCKHIFRIAVACNDQRVLKIVRDLATRLCVDFKLARKSP